MKIAAVGDVHGCLEQMNDLIAIVVAKHSPDLFVFLGDYVDRGPDSRGVIAKIKSLHGDKRFVFLKGNHDDMMAGTVLRGHDEASWLINGGTKTVVQYMAEQDIMDDAKFLDALPTSYIAKNHVFVHGGIPGTETDLNGIDDMLMWYRGDQRKWGTRRVVHGHTPVRKAVITDNEINVDTGCCFGGPLTAAIIDDESCSVELVHSPTPTRDNSGGGA